MTVPYRKKLIEVALPLTKINEAAAREKSIRHGHPSTLHLWWARRPLAACRAVLFASLVDDPDSDPDFKFDENVAASKRAKLFNLIEELVLWENSNNPRVINAARAEIARCVASRKLELEELKADDKIGSATIFDIKGMLAKPEDVNAFLAEHAPPVLDPFCGGGSIPLEAQRLGLRAYASDLNPVPVLITKALIEIPPKFAGRPPVNPDWQKKSKEEKAGTAWHGAQGLAADVRYYGQWMRDEAEKRIGHLYPKVKITKEMAKDRPDLEEYVGEQLTAIAWLWARTVASPNPAARGAHVPLIRSFWLGTKPGKEAWIQPIVDSQRNQFAFQVGTGKPPQAFDPASGTVNRKGGRCLLTNTSMPFAHIRSEAQAGRMRERLMAVVAEGVRSRAYLGPERHHETIAQSARPRWRPEGEMPKKHRNFQPPVYGMNSYSDVFTSRQLVSLDTFCELICEVRDHVIASDGWAKSAKDDASRAPLTDGGKGLRAYADAVVTYLALAIDRLANYSSTLCTWHSGVKYETLTSTFGRQALPMTWDFAEGNPFSDSSGNFCGQVRGVAANIENCFPGSVAPGRVTQLDAVATSLNEQVIVSTDPPYYDNIGYADLSDFFYVWLRRSLSGVFPSVFSTLLTPKARELIASSHRFEGSDEKARAFFEHGLGEVFRRLAQVQASNVPFTVFYAFKQTEDPDSDKGNDRDETESAQVSTGWETMLEGLIAAGFSVTGTWPMRTELVGNLKKNISALASSVVLVCRPRPADAPLATRKQFITALRQELPDALRNLQRGNIAPVDLAQAAIGPGMAVFTRYAKVMETDGSAMSVRTALGLINQALDEVLAEQEGEFDGDTRWALAWFEQFGMEPGAFGVAETLSKAKNTAVNGLVEAGCQRILAAWGTASGDWPSLALRVSMEPTPVPRLRFGLVYDGRYPRLRFGLVLRLIWRYLGRMSRRCRTRSRTSSPGRPMAPGCRETSVAGSSTGADGSFPMRFGNSRRKLG